jgi:mono/diheme cytochrome c family protein
MPADRYFVRIRRWSAGLIVVGSLLAVAWKFAPGLPVLWGPSGSEENRRAGKDLFVHEWEPNDPLAGGDGLGPVFNARSCVACHFQGGVGGAGPNPRNIIAFEVLPVPGETAVRTGSIHAHSTEKTLQETETLLRSLFPPFRGSLKLPDRDRPVFVEKAERVRTESLNSTALFGAGWIDRISPRNIQTSHLARTVDATLQNATLEFNSIGPGRVRILPDGRVGKFGWKAQFATLREFVAAACANEIGLSNPVMEQARPIGGSSIETGSPDLDEKQFADLVTFVDTLPPPVQILPKDPEPRSKVTHGREVFERIGCAVCHIPDLGGLQGVYSDFLLHSLETKQPGEGPDRYRTEKFPLPRPDDSPRPEEWRTPPLWGVADSAPYFHDGASPTLHQAIARHGGDAAVVTRNYLQLPGPDRDALLAFLLTLKAPPEAEPAPIANSQKK